MAVAGVGALTVGVNLLPPPGSRPFSVGDTEGAVVVVVVVVVVDGDSSELPPQADKAAIATNASAPTPVATRRRAIRVCFMVNSHLSASSEVASPTDPGSPNSS